MLLDSRQQLLTSQQFLWGETLHAEAAHLVVGGGGIADKAVGIVLGPHKTTRLTGGRDAFVEPHDVRNPDGRQRGQDITRLVSLDNRAHPGPVRRLNRPRVRPLIFVSGENPMAAGRMRVVVGRHRPHDRHLVRELGGAWQQFTELHARNDGADGLKRTTNIDGRIGLRVERLVLRRPPCQIQKDDILRAAERIVGKQADRCRLAGLQELGQRHAEHAQPPHAQNFASRQTVAKPRGTS